MSKKITTKDFIKRSIKAHGLVYDYSNSEYIDSKTYVVIICLEHGAFNQYPYDHMSGKGCKKCSYKKKGLKKRLTKIDFIEKSKRIHGETYLYDKSEYIKSITKTIITCRIHGDFHQTPNGHLSGRGCPKCRYIKSSKNKTKKHIIDKQKNIIQPVEFKIIPLGNNYFSKVDNEDFEVLNKLNWCSDGKGYAFNNKVGFMHRYIMNPKNYQEIDHINHDTLDNRKSNLRIVTHAQNCMNRKKRKGTSKYKGVSWDKERNKWVSKAQLNYKTIYIGGFENEIDAAKAYDKKSLEIFGEYAKTNF